LAKADNLFADFNAWTLLCSGCGGGGPAERRHFKRGRMRFSAESRHADFHPVAPMVATSLHWPAMRQPALRG